jgi:hypothetical protein
MFYKTPPFIINRKAPPLHRQLETLHEAWSGVTKNGYELVEVNHFNDGDKKYLFVVYKLFDRECVSHYNHTFVDNRSVLTSGKRQIISSSVLIIDERHHVLRGWELEELVVQTFQHEEFWLIKDFPSFGDLWVDNEDQHSKVMNLISSLRCRITVLMEEVILLNSVMTNADQISEKVSLTDIIKSVDGSKDVL